MQVTFDTCMSIDDVFDGVSDSSFVLSGNLVMLSSKQISDALTGALGGVQSRFGAVKSAIAAFFHRFKDQFDAVAVFPSTPQGTGEYIPSEHWSWHPDYTGAPENLKSAIIHNMASDGYFIPFKHEILHRFGVFNDKIPKKIGSSSVYSHWGLSALGNAGGQLGGWPQSAVDCTNGEAPNKNQNPACPDNKLRFTVKEGSTRRNNDGEGMSEFELLMMGLIGPNEVSNDVIVCDSVGSSVPGGREYTGEHYVGDCVNGIKL